MSSLLHNIARPSLNLVGILFLADIDAVARRTALTGGTWLGDIFVLCPGLHRQQDAPSLSKGEFPACAAMTTGYVFRVENEATVLYLQRVGKTGHLTILAVSHASSVAEPSLRNIGFATMAYQGLLGLTLAIIGRLCFLGDFYALVSLSLLIFVRAANTLIIRRRASGSWQGQSEPGALGDLLVLLSQDRWVRIQGSVDDLKAVTSGQWLRELRPSESLFTCLATISVYLAAMLAADATQEGKMLLLMLSVVTATAVSIVNVLADDFNMNGRVLHQTSASKSYKRRLDLADELIRETGRRDWALRMGMVQPEKGEEGAVTM